MILQEYVTVDHSASRLGRNLIMHAEVVFPSNKVRFAQKQPLGLSGEWLLYPNTGHSSANIQFDLRGCF